MTCLIEKGPLADVNCITQTPPLVKKKLDYQNSYLLGLAFFFCLIIENLDSVGCFPCVRALCVCIACYD